MIALPDGMPCDNFGKFVTNGTFLATTKQFMASCPLRELSKVFIYQKTKQGWIPYSIIEASDLSLNGPIARVIGIDNSRLVISYSDDSSYYSVNQVVVIYRFDGFNWVIEQRLSAPDVSDDLGFGDDGAISGSTMLIAAPNARINDLAYKGAIYAYQFDGSTWILRQKITDAADYRTLFFGSPLILHDDTLFVGFPMSFDGGKVNEYQLVNDQWTLDQVITSANVNYQANFGSALALDNGGNTLVVGAITDGIGTGTSQGSAIVFEKVDGAWAEKAKLIGPSPRTDDGFGGAVAIQGDAIYIGAYRRNTGHPGSGAVYVFYKPVSGWDNVPPSHEIKSPNSGFFGSGIYPDGNSLLISSPFEDINGQVNQGAIHVFYRGISNSQFNSPFYEGDKGIPLSFILDSPPEHPVTITIKSNDPSIIFSEGSITFQPEQWNLSQDFLIEILDNCLIEVTKTVELSFDVTSDDVNYNHIQIYPIFLLVNEKFILKTHPMSMEEGKSQENTLYIWKPPSQPVYFSSEENPWIQVDPNPLTFQLDDQVRQFNVSALDDKLFLGDHFFVLRITSHSQDPFFDNITICLPISTLENDYFTYLPLLSNQ
jgi:hypothetical protein